ncbi:CD225/dispanin family protein [Cellulomonas edaphi]|uniref:CD225/dispanin family protein n=1 Tax=Cellulomonas edaphi TaxID=3053468 RepID=A0ABT7S615_9CELL|nr:CD225/dispanin family protein [Cellulomons edaphi]MDM7831058.1 CD225/dispanin family protein [Cellulomons edaphi]
MTQPTESVPPPVPSAPPGEVPAPPSPYVARPAVPTAPVGWVIAAMLLFWPTGIPALLASHRAAQAIGAGDLEVADVEAARGRRWAVISVIVGGALVALSILASIILSVVLALAVHERHGDDWTVVRPDSGQQLPFGDRDRLGVPDRPGAPDRPGSGG